jgi:adenylate cyclase
VSPRAGPPTELGAQLGRSPIATSGEAGAAWRWLLQVGGIVSSTPGKTCLSNFGICGIRPRTPAQVPKTFFRARPAVAKRVSAADRQKSDPYRSAVLRLTYYMNRAGTQLDAQEKDKLEQAEIELRKLFGRGWRGASAASLGSTERASLAGGMKTIAVERSLACRSDPEALWCVIADTERLNRAVGLGSLEIAPHNDDTAARFVIKTSSGGVPLEYQEPPFEWVENERFTVRREMHGGLVMWMRNTFILKPGDGGGTTVTLDFELMPRTRLLAPVLRIQLRRFVERMLREIGRLDADLAEHRAARYTHGKPRLDELALERAAAALRAERAPEQAAVAERLVAFVRDASDADVGRIRPFDLANRWQLDRRVVLEVCLDAVGSGLLELAWDLVCPSCRTAADRLATLNELGREGHCQLCDISFDLELDRAVEATFRPTRAVRAVDEGPYCIGGPQRTPHVVVQALLPASGSRVIAAPRRPGAYRVFVRGGAVTELAVTEGGDASGKLRVEGDALEPAALGVAPGASIEIEQTGGGERHVKIERLGYAENAATAHIVSMLPVFRRRFGSEILRPGVTLRVGRVALLFTDLTGSTALYGAVGDAKAFKVVRDHFDLLREIVECKNGVIVKTIGDAVMAAFAEERDALAAAVEMHRAFPRFRAESPEASATFLKIGVYAGPCYTVTANGVLDYFGQSVNLAARLQGAARGGEIVLPAELADEADERGWLDGAPPSERFEAKLKGVQGPMRVARVTVDRPEA